jgi:YniB-like protein
MNLVEAKKRVTKQRIISAAIIIVSVIFFVLVVLKSIYISVADNPPIFHDINIEIQRLVQPIYKSTHFLLWFWKWTPVPNIMALNTSGNYGLLFILLCGAIGRIMWQSAEILSSRLSRMTQKIKDLEWEREIIRQHDQSVDAELDMLQINIELERKEQWYKRPVGLLLFGVAVAVLGQWANLRFGLLG